jgi:L-rhamnose mutarotase
MHMPRVAFRLRIKRGKEEEYDAAHKNVWPALLAKLKEVGISQYSIFRREQDLFLFMQVAISTPRGARSTKIRRTSNGSRKCPNYSNRC